MLIPPDTSTLLSVVLLLICAVLFCEGEKNASEGAEADFMKHGAKEEKSGFFTTQEKTHTQNTVKEDGDNTARLTKQSRRTGNLLNGTHELIYLR